MTINLFSTNAPTVDPAPESHSDPPPTRELSRPSAGRRRIGRPRLGLRGTGRPRLGRRPALPLGRLWGPSVILLFWGGASAAGLLDPRSLPAPWTVLATGYQLWTTGTLASDITTSLVRAASGFAIGLTGGVVLAVTAGLSRVGEAMIDGTVQIKRAIPTLGLIPLFILWLGIGEPFKIAIIALSVFVPIYINLYSALAGIETRYVELAQVLGFTRPQFILQVVAPSALPGFFVGLRLAVTTSWLALVVLEQINATSGLGYMMFQAQNYGQTVTIFVGLLLYGAFGFVSDAGVRLIERKALSWRQTWGS